MKLDRFSMLIFNYPLFNMFARADRDKMRPNFQFLAQFFGNLLNTPEDNNNTNDIANGAAAADAIAEDNEHDEGEEQHLNEADVYHV